MAVLVRTHPGFLFAPRDQRFELGVAQNAITTTGPLSVVPFRPPPCVGRLSPADRPGPGRHRCTVQPRGRFVPPPGTTRHRAERTVAGQGMWSAVFWQDTSDRVVRTFASSFLTVTGGPAALNALPLVNLHLPVVGWSTALTYSASMAFLSLMTCLAASGVGDPSSASFMRRVRWTPPPGRHEKV